MMLYSHRLGRVHSYSEGSEWGIYAMQRKHLNYFEIAHFDANVICARKIPRVLKSEGGGVARPIRIRHWLQ